MCMGFALFYFASFCGIRIILIRSGHVTFAGHTHARTATHPVLDGRSHLFNLIHTHTQHTRLWWLLITSASVFFFCVYENTKPHAACLWPMLAWLASWLASAFMHMQRNTCLQTISGLCSIAENRFGRTHEIFIIWLWCAPYSSGDYNFEAGKSANETSKTKPKYCFGNYYSNRMKRRHHHRSGNLFTQLERLCYRYSHTECNAMSMECTKECKKKPRLTTIFASFTLHKICVVGLVSCIVRWTHWFFVYVCAVYCVYRDIFRMYAEFDV